jgi:hypothetical protein
MPTELTHLRGARSKTFLLDDGVTRRLEVGGGHAHHHHPVTGEFVDTDCNWKDVLAKFHIGDAGEHPFLIGIDKATRTLSIDFQNGDVITLSPKGARVPTSATKTANTVTLVRLWTGITLKLILSPEGLHFHYIKTATTFVNPSFTVTGPWESYYGPCSWLGVTTPMPNPVQQTLVGGVLTYDFSAVPVGVVVV